MRCYYCWCCRLCEFLLSFGVDSVRQGTELISFTQIPYQEVRALPAVFKFQDLSPLLTGKLRGRLGSLQQDTWGCAPGFWTCDRPALPWGGATPVSSTNTIPAQSQGSAGLNPAGEGVCSACSPGQIPQRPWPWHRRNGFSSAVVVWSTMTSRKWLMC